MALRQRLRAVFESVWWCFGALVNHWQGFILFNESKLHLRSLALDGTGGHVAGHAQALLIDGITLIDLSLQLRDGDVITLALLHAVVGDICERKQDDGNGGAEFKVLRVLRRHRFRLYAPAL